MKAEAIDPNAKTYDIARCPLPDCAGYLYMHWHTTNELYASFTSEDLAEPGGSTSWEIECEYGHKLMFPRDDTNADHTFGFCECEDYYTDDERAFCQHNDMKKLRELLAYPGKQ